MSHFDHSLCLLLVPHLSPLTCCRANRQLAITLDTTSSNLPTTETVQATNFITFDHPAEERDPNPASFETDLPPSYGYPPQHSLFQPSCPPAQQPSNTTDQAPDYPPATNNQTHTSNEMCDVQQAQLYKITIKL